MLNAYRRPPAARRPDDQRVAYILHQQDKSTLTRMLGIINGTGQPLCDAEGMGKGALVDKLVREYDRTTLQVAMFEALGAPFTAPLSVH